MRPPPPPKKKTNGFINPFIPRFTLTFSLQREGLPEVVREMLVDPSVWRDDPTVTSNLDQESGG